MERQRRKYKSVKACLNRKGESLIECLASLLILTILITTISLAIDFSLRTTVRAVHRANTLQGRANDAVLGIAADEEMEDGCTLTLTFSGGISANVDVRVIKKGDVVGDTVPNPDYVAFEPALGGGP